jgi:hypothetical protein
MRPRTMTEADVRARIRALQQYEYSIVMSEEVSDAKERELDRLMLEKSKLYSMLARFKNGL